MKNCYGDTIGDFHPVSWYATKYHYCDRAIRKMIKNGLKCYRRDSFIYISEEDFHKYMNGK